MNRIIIILIVMILATSVGFSQSVPEKRISKPIDVMATGGAGVAGYNKFGLAFVNPASVCSKDYATFSILEIGASLNPDLFSLIDIAGVLTASSDTVGNLNQLTADQWKTILNLNANLGLQTPIKLGWYGKGLSILAYNEVYAGIGVNQSTGIPTFNANIYVDFGAIVGYAFDFYFPSGILTIPFVATFDHLYVGANLKLIERMRYTNPRLSILEAVDLGASIAEGKSGVALGTGIGSDIGAILRSESLSFGIAIRDWFATPFFWQEITINNFMPTTNILATTYVNPSVDIGASYRIAELINGFLFSDFMAYFDMVDIFNFSEQYFMKFRIGAEITTLKILKLRVGLYKGYPTVGIGLDLPVLKINATYYVEELGQFAGAIPQQIIMANIQFML